MHRQPVISQKDSDDSEQIEKSQQIQFKKTNAIPKFIRSSQSMTLKLNAIIRSGYFNDFQTLSVSYSISSGQSWKNVAGQISGISQMSHSPDGQIVWNFPLQVSYQTNYLADPPQIILVLYGHDFFGRTIPKAYGNIHFPLSEGIQRRKVRTFKMNQYSWFTKVYSLVTGTYYEFKQIQKVLNSQQRRPTLRTKTCGSVEIQFETKKYNFEKYGYQT